MKDLTIQKQNITNITNIVNKQVIITEKIFSIKNEYVLDDEIFISIISLITQMNDLPKNTPRCEDILFENIVLLHKDVNCTKLNMWLQKKLFDLFEKHNVDILEGANLIIDAIQSIVKKPHIAKCFYIYAYVEGKVNKNPSPLSKISNTIASVLKL